MAKDRDVKRSDEAPPPEADRGWGQQILGALAGLLVAAVVLQIAPRLGWEPQDPVFILILGATLGSFANTLGRFELAGSRLTRRTDDSLGTRILNILVAFVGLVIIGVLVLGLSFLVARGLDALGLEF